MTGELLLTLAGGASLLAWLMLTFGHGRFWLGDQRLGGDPPTPEPWPAVVAVIASAEMAPAPVRSSPAVSVRSAPDTVRSIASNNSSHGP